MPSPKKNAAYTFYTSLADAAAMGVLKSNPTLAAGDVKVSIDGGAFTNLGTLPVVEPAGSRMVKVVLSAAEMNGDRIVVQFVDQTSPAEWIESVIPIQTNTITIEELAAYVDTEIAAIKSQTDQLAFTNAGKVDAAIITAADFAAAVLAAIADAVHDEAVDGAVTLRQSIRLANSANAGKLSGAASANVLIRDLADSKNRINATVDADGNRTAVTVDVS